MRKVLLTIALLVSLPSLSFAQQVYEDCLDCAIGIFDDPGMTKNYGSWAPDINNPTTWSKKIYVGVKFAQGIVGLTAFEISIQGLVDDDAFGAPTIELKNNPNVVVGPNIRTPPDTTVMTADGGQTIGFPTCQAGDLVLVEITMRSFDPLPSDTIFRILRKFPPSHPGAPFPLFNQCDDPAFTKTRVTPGCYVLNNTVGPGESVGDPPCTLVSTAVDQSTWSRIKRLYR